MLEKFTVFSLLCFLGVYNISLAQSKIEFETSTYDFGQIEEGTVAEHEFVFINHGDQPLIISSVKASCGCTTPGWTKEPVMPGKEGYIKASYNSKNRPGGFHKSITITSNASPPTKVVYIKGVTVKSTILKPMFSKEELENAPKVEILEQHLQLGKIQIGSSIPISFRVQNNGKSPLEINGVYSNCRCLSLMPGKNLVIEPGSREILELIYTPKALGELTHGAYILSNDLIQPKYQIYLTSTNVSTQNKSSLVKETPSSFSF